ncbi:MAG: diguanylate cyclase [Pseudomonas sp.]|jgi:GGDEF domain-containing protein|nr:diguanylate cyclase [Pseudomonas sp.]
MIKKVKPVNDVHGHIVGDLLLIEVARRLKQCVRETDTIAASAAMNISSYSVN